MPSAADATRRTPEQHRFWNLRRITSGSSWIPEIDGLRFIAITLVVLFHLLAQVGSKSIVHLSDHAWYRWLFDVLRRGDIGVRIFFVISGFILGRPFARHYLLGHAKPSLRSYYLRRLTRLEPPYLINIFICAAAIGIYSHFPVRPLLLHVAASTVYMHSLFFNSNVLVLNPVVWTLEMEVQFYLIVPLLALLFAIPNPWLRRLILGGATVAYPLFLTTFVFAHVHGDSHFWATVAWLLQYFLAGLFLSDFYVVDMPNWRQSWLWDAVSLPCWAIILGTMQQGLYVFEPLLIALAFVAAFRGKLLHRALTIEWVAIVGGMCYSIYLWHFFVISLIFKLSRHVTFTHDLMANYLVQCVLVLPCVLAFSVLYFVLIERPCMDPAWPQKLWAAVSGGSRRPEAA